MNRSGNRTMRLLPGANKLSRTLAAALMFPAVLLSAVAQGAANEEPQYLAFQVFTGSPNPNMAFGADPVLGEMPSKKTLSDFAGDLIARIGTTRQAGESASRKLTLVFGPLSFDHSDAQIRQLISTAFDVALEQDIAIGFHIDDSMFWGRRRDLLADAANIERAGWTDPPAHGRRLDWGPQPTQAPPPMCINSSAIEREVRSRAAVIGNAISAGLVKLRAASREELFAAVTAGWETQIGRDFSDNRPLGFCALANRGVKPGASDVELYDARVATVGSAYLRQISREQSRGVAGRRSAHG